MRENYCNSLFGLDVGSALNGRIWVLKQLSPGVLAFQF